jgi:hypothetical protein
MFLKRANYFTGQKTNKDTRGQGPCPNYETEGTESLSILSPAGYSLSDSEQSDLVILFCLEKKIYDINYVNETLDYFSLKPLSVGCFPYFMSNHLGRKWV